MSVAQTGPGHGLRAPGDRTTRPRGPGTASWFPRARPIQGITGCPRPHRQPSDPRPRVLVVSDGALRRMRVPRALRRAGLDAPYGVDPLRADAELRRGGWDLLVWAGGRAELAREALGLPRRRRRSCW